jgi:ATP-dependent DNA helicase RecQ
VDLLELLKRHWGYSAFRPKQEAIIRALLGRRDVAAVMPTGGGKSLCYQLPAVAMQQMCVVISPLIALMHDQASQLTEARIPAAYLNSSITWREQEQVKRAAESGKLRLLYFAPERAVREDTLEWLKRLPVGFFAIDEAHCISEWGHEFRPEYRRLSTLRSLFPDKPIAAFTASATRQVRHDIVAQLGLRSPETFVASFRRPNLRYSVRQSDDVDYSKFLVHAARAYPDQNIIIYAPTIKTVESTAYLLNVHGVPAIAYHGQMESAERSRNQSIWMNGEKRVMVATIAFGLGINKRDVRAVIHMSMPKSLEQYYQEAGRAGRDGNPADCVLLWRKRDSALLVHFINEVQDPRERERSWQRYHAIRRYIDTNGCRQTQICTHFGEPVNTGGCGTCDICGSKPEWLDAKPENVRKTRISAREKPPVGTSNVDACTRARLRKWRYDLANDRNLPPYCILHDKTLDEICRRMPANVNDLLTIPGIGPRKVADWGKDLIDVLHAG